MVRRRLFVLLGPALLAVAPAAPRAAGLGPVTAAPAVSASPTPAPARPRGSRARQLQDVLDARAEAVRRRDRSAFLDTVDSAQRAFLDAQTAWFDRLAALPVADYRLEIDDEEDLTRTSDRERYGPQVAVVPAGERLRFEGYGDVPLGGPQFLTFVRRHGRWRVASDTGVEDLGLTTTRHPWDYGPASAHTSEHFLLIVHPDELSYADELLSQAEQALPDVGRVWLRPWDMHIPVEVPSSTEELGGYLGGGLDVSKFVAFALSSYDPENDWRWDGSRIVLNRGNFLGLPPAVRRAILTHELTHVASHGARGPFAVTFVEEGLADLAAGKTGGPQLDRQVRSGTFNRRLPENYEFVSGAREDIQAAYEKASSALGYMGRTFSTEGINRFFEAYGAVTVAPGTARYRVDQAFRTALGLPLDEFERRWAQTVAPRR